MEVSDTQILVAVGFLIVVIGYSAGKYYFENKADKLMSKLISNDTRKH